ncbi:MAG TPA: N-acetyl-gamma-glutamyl-phosphate reductase [Polyangia bacterium]|jgi:N-acetyl-gamma-glutamyl-phosphate reductase
MTAPTIPVAVLGGTGYVAGELLRLLAGHPVFRVAAAGSTSQEGEPVRGAFPHLAGTAVDGLRFESTLELARRFEPDAPFGVFTATPHGATAALVELLLTAAEAARARVRVVDLSADFRYPDAADYAAVYGHAHDAPARLEAFHCSLPEQLRGKPPVHAVQPGCFTTAVTLGAWPFYALDLVEGSLFAAAVTGSSGSGRSPGAGTHHPERHSDLRAYSPLVHRHEPEVRRLLGLGRDGPAPEVELVPCSGPFVRGIHATLRLTLRTPTPAAELVTRVNDFYAPSPFVRASVESPRLTEVVGTNRARLGLTTRGRTLVVTAVIDNLIKGAAGGGIQWMNRLFDLPDDAGLTLGGLGWY